MYEFYKKYFLLNLKDYPSLGIDLYITVILFIFSLVFIAVTIIVNFRRAKMELLLRQLKRRDALNEESAKTLKELRLGGFVFHRLLSVEGQLTKLVGRVGEVKYSYKEYIDLLKKRGAKKSEKIDFSTARFYIRDVKNPRTIKLLENDSPTILNTILLCVLIIAIFVCLALLLPGLMGMINDFIASKAQ